MSTVRIGDIDVAYTEAGPEGGAPVVLLHGLAEDRHTWRRQQEALGDVHTFAYDLRGHGESGLGQPEETLAQLGRDLIGFLEEVPGPATVVGFSLGGTITLWAAAERPDLVRHAIVLGTSSVVGRAAAEFYEQRIATAADTGSEEFRTAVRDDTAAAIVKAADFLDEVVDARLRAVGAGGGYINAARAMAQLNTEPLTPRLAQVTGPVDVVGADGDTFCPMKASQIILDALPDARFHEVVGAGHLMNIDNPQGVTDVVRAALTERN